MKLVLFSLVFFLLSCSSYDLDWSHNYSEALAQAKKEDKNVYLFIGADNCVHCERYKDLTLSKKEVMDVLKEDYIPLFLNRDRHEIPKRFETQGVPRHYFLRPDGSMIHADAGSREPAGFYDILDEVDLKLDD